LPAVIVLSQGVIAMKVCELLTVMAGSEVLVEVLGGSVCAPVRCTLRSVRLSPVSPDGSRDGLFGPLPPLAVAALMQPGARLILVGVLDLPQLASGLDRSRSAGSAVSLLRAAACSSGR
jgi:hypothetical protein